MFYFDASQQGRKVFINPQNPIYIEVPAVEAKDGFMLYDGIRNKEGKVRWTNPKPLQKWLLSMDLGILNFYREILKLMFIKVLLFVVTFRLVRN